MAKKLGKEEITAILNTEQGAMLLEYLQKKYVDCGLYAATTKDGMKAAMDMAYHDGQAEVVRQLTRIQQSGDK